MNLWKKLEALTNKPFIEPNGLSDIWKLLKIERPGFEMFPL